MSTGESIRLPCFLRPGNPRGYVNASSRLSRFHWMWPHICYLRFSLFGNANVPYLSAFINDWCVRVHRQTTSSNSDNNSNSNSNHRLLRSADSSRTKRDCWVVLEVELLAVVVAVEEGESSTAKKKKELGHLTP